MENKNDGCRACGREHGEEQEGGRWALAEILLSAALFLAALFLAPEAGPWRLACFAVPYLLAGWRVLREAAENILRGEVFDENFLMTVASVGALCIGEYPEAVAVMVLYRVGEYCEDLAVEKSRRSIAGLMDICPETAAVERDGQTVTVGPGEVAVGEIILVKPASGSRWTAWWSPAPRPWTRRRSPASPRPGTWARARASATAASTWTACCASG